MQRKFQPKRTGGRGGRGGGRDGGSEPIDLAPLVPPSPHLPSGPIPSGPVVQGADGGTVILGGGLGTGDQSWTYGKETKQSTTKKSK